MFCYVCICFFFFKQKTAYEMRISDWSSDVCSSDLQYRPRAPDVVAWAQVRHAPIDLKRFWLPDDRVVAVEPGTLPSISAAYTFDTWEGVLRPWLQTADDLAPQSEAALADFRKGYFEAY